MSNPLTLEDIDQSLRSSVYRESYSKKPAIDGVKIVEIPNFIGEEGDFSEVIKLDEKGELLVFPGFKLAQVNRTKMYPKAVKAWHVHLKQDEIWFLRPSDHLLVGLWDIRKESQSNGMKMRVSLGGGKSQLLFIPKGVAHGLSNTIHHEVEMFYFVNQQFNIQEPDEYRIDWDYTGPNFWNPERDKQK